ncbi:MAG: hypothetical protein Q4C87_01900 [Actinomycetaceae bacterium]|nr:hypothetical protein [Actinomycetaceae bacterium]
MSIRRTPEQNITDIRRYIEAGQWLRAKSLYARLPLSFRQRYRDLWEEADVLTREMTALDVRHQPQEGSWGLFSYEILVHCPQCHKPGRISRQGYRKGREYYCVFSCLHCGTIKDERPRRFAAADYPTDGYFGFEIVLKTRTRHGWLWVYNQDHLAEMRAFLYARLREPIPGETSRACCTYNTNWASRLPTWITSGKNREEIWRALERISALV